VTRKYITYETLDEGRIVRITLNRVDSRNAQNRGLLIELGDAFLKAEANDVVRVVILAGAGPLFSSGKTWAPRIPSPSALSGRTCIPATPSTAGPRRAPRSGCYRSGTTFSRTRCAGATSARSRSPRFTGPSSQPA
jgi:enoyl-CoA hydratase